MNAQAEIDHATLAEEIPLDEINVSNPKLYEQDVWQPYFRRLRRDAPVHYCKESPVGPFWSVTKYKNLVVTEVDHKTFSSSGGIVLRDQPVELEIPSFIAMDAPGHTDRRKVVQPIVSPGNLAAFEGLIRS